MDYRIGLGYDIHRLVRGRKLLIGGVELSFPKGLLGHSDADVLLHAVADALLGAAGEPDIGELFPDTDAAYRDASSVVLLKKVHAMIKAKKFEIHNIDVVILAQQPKISPFKAEMRRSLAKILEISEERVNLKAKTTEKLGHIGSGKAISAYAVALLEKGE